MALTARTTRLPRRTHLSLRRVLLTAVAFLAMLVIAIYAGISAVVADNFSRPERHPVTNTPAAYGLAYEPVEFMSAVDNIRLEGWYIGGQGSKVILMLHGRNGNRSSGDSALPLAQAFVKHGYDVFMFDFRAHGESGGTHASFGELEVRDVAGALVYLNGRGINEVGTIGFSLGAATALNSAPDHPEMRAIVADSSFADGALLAETGLPKLSGLPPIVIPGMILMGRFMYGADLTDDLPVRAVARLGSRPVLLIHGTADEMVPVSHAYMLQKAGANDPNLQLWILPNVCHTCAYAQNPEEYTKRVIAFFDRNL
jgi:pimeloyl-ACP methyl ester carboxylesterase